MTKVNWNAGRVTDKLTGLYQNGELRLILHSKDNAEKIIEILRKDEKEKKDESK